jgi:hypothetical protein
MDITRYYGTVHPEEWLKQVQTICIINNIEESDVLKLCKLNIDPSITIPNEINTLNELAKVLKAHSTFEIYKNDCKRRLDRMSFRGEEDSDITKFLADFRSLCFKAEITCPQKIKNHLSRTYSSNEFFKNEFSKRVTGVTSIDEIYRLYIEVILDNSNGTEFSVASKDLVVGRHSSSCKRQVVS